MSKPVTSLFRGLVALLSTLLSTVVIVAATGTALAQFPQPMPSATPPFQTPAAVQDEPSTSLTQTAEARPLHGVQGVLVETMDGKVVASQSVDQQFNPASAVKLATALVALHTLGAQHRFATGIWTDGTLDKATGTLQGSVYVSGRDPSFHYEHALLIGRQLNALGIKQISGDLIVAPGFTMNFSWSASRSGDQLRDTLDSTRRYADATRAWEYERSLLPDHPAGNNIPSVTVLGTVGVAPVPANARLLFTQKSSRLAEILKVLLCYSNNFMAERIGDSLGGADAITRELTSLLNLGPTEIRLSSSSGLGTNRVSPRIMMKIYRALLVELKKNNLSASDLLPVAGIDPGTMKDRFTGMAWRGSVIAKTGTLVRTDGGASALVGQLKAADGEVLLFVIMNQRGSVSRFRENQDYFLMLIQNTRGGPKAFSYKPIMLAMQLSDTETVAAGDEYEPKSNPQ